LRDLLRPYPGDEAAWAGARVSVRQPGTGTASARGRQAGLAGNGVSNWMGVMEMQPRNGREEGRATNSEAAAASVRLTGSRMMMPVIADWEGGFGGRFEVEEQVAHMRSAALREAAQQARRAAAERLEAARRAEAAAMADSIARREEREIAEAQASVFRQAAKFAEAEMRSRRRRYLHPEIAVNWRSIGLPGTLRTAGDAGPRRLPEQVLEVRDLSGATEPLALAESGAPRLQNERNSSYKPNGSLSLAEREHGAEPAARPVQHEEGSRQPAAEVVSRISDAPLEDACWCEAESLIGCGYSQCGGAYRARSGGRRGESRAGASDGRVAAGAPESGAAAEVRQLPAPLRWSGLKRAMVQAGSDLAGSDLAGRDLASSDLARRGPATERGNAAPKRRSGRFVLVYSLAGGAGKTSLVANMGRALASLGEKVLLAEMTEQRLLPLYFGASGLQANFVRSFPPPEGRPHTPVNVISYDAAGWETGRDAGRATNPDRSERDTHAEMFEDILMHARRADRVLIDLSVSCGWLAARMAWLGPRVLVPLAADMNSVVSLQAVERSFHAMQDGEGRPLEPVYLLNQFDASSALHREVREVLRGELGERLLPFSIRRSSGVGEALAEGTTVVDCDPESEVAKDYFGLAEWLLTASMPAASDYSRATERMEIRP